jgi:hypothetical protein
MAGYCNTHGSFLTDGPRCPKCTSRPPPSSAYAYVPGGMCLPPSGYGRPIRKDERKSPW